MSALDDFIKLLDSTDVMQQLMDSLKQEPAYLLGEICREYGRTGNAVADHKLKLVGYMGEAALRALISARLITRTSGGVSSVYAYQPTEEGLKQYNKLKDEHFFKV